MSEPCPSPHACSWKGLMSPHTFPRRIPCPPPMSHAYPVTTSAPPPCPVVPPGCHRLIRAVSVSSHGSLVWGFHGEVTVGLGIEGPKRQVWGLRAVPREEGGPGLSGGVGQV